MGVHINQPGCNPATRSIDCYRIFCGGSLADPFNLAVTDVEVSLFEPLPISRQDGCIGK